MRVIAGDLGGQRTGSRRARLEGPPRPPIGFREGDLLGARRARSSTAAVLDLYSGTGAPGDRGAPSARGAAHAVLVDRDTRPALGNVERLGLRERAELVRAEVGRWPGGGSRWPHGGPFRPRLRRCPL